MKRWYYILYPMRAYVVTSSHGGKIGAMTAAWVMPTSIDPPMLVVAIAPRRYTYTLIRMSGEFAVNVFEYKYMREVYYLGSVSGWDEPKKVEKSGLHLKPGRSVGAPVFEEAHAVAECKVENIVPAGDHDLVVGRVVDYYYKPPLGEGRPDVSRFKALIHVGGSHFTTTIGESRSARSG